MIIVFIGGVAFSLSLQSLTENCTSSPTSPALFGVSSCSGLLATALTGSAIGGIALALGVLLLRQADVEPARRVPLAAGIFVALLVVLAATPFVLTPPVGNLGVAPQLPFPIPLGTTFNVTLSPGDAYAEAQVPLDPVAPDAPIILQGGYNATSTVCVTIARAAGADLGPDGHSVCGTSVTFSLGITSSTWAIGFYIPTENPQTAFRATVVVTQAVDIVY